MSDEGHGWWIKAVGGATLAGVIGLGFWYIQSEAEKLRIPANTYTISMKVVSSNCSEMLVPGQFFRSSLTFSEATFDDGYLTAGELVQITRGDGASLGAHTFGLPRFEFEAPLGNGASEHWIITWESASSSRARVEYFGPDGCVFEAEEQGGM
jgi:hypothetical protein